jgi:uncharacterized MAPEG superfamily protein
VVNAGIHDFFVAGASVAGALVGLLFVAVTVAAEKLRPNAKGAQVNRIRASAALTAFTSALSVSIFALIPGHTIGPASVAVGAGGLLFVTASLLSLVRLHALHVRTLRDSVFLVGMIVTFVVLLFSGIQVILSPGNSGAVNTIAVLVAVCFLIGIDRAWELVGGPSIGISSEVVALLRGRGHGAGGPNGEEPAP